eukprot:6265613-Amphidinium_carterae.1
MCCQPDPPLEPPVGQVANDFANACERRPHIFTCACGLNSKYKLGHSNGHLSVGDYAPTNSLSQAHPKVASFCQSAAKNKCVCRRFTMAHTLTKHAYAFFTINSYLAVLHCTKTQIHPGDSSS